MTLKKLMIVGVRNVTATSPSTTWSGNTAGSLHCLWLRGFAL